MSEPITPAGAPTARDLAAILGERKSVKDFGCKGDGRADDTAAFRAALERCLEDGGGHVFVPPGDYNIAPQLTVYANTTVEFAAGAWIRTTAPYYHVVKVSSGASNVTLINPQVDCGRIPGLNGLGVGGNEAGHYVRRIRVFGGHIKGARQATDATETYAGGGRGMTAERYCEDFATFGVTIEDCDVGVAVQGSIAEGNGPAYAVRHHGLFLDGCATAIMIFDVPDAGRFVDDGRAMQVSFLGADLRNCGRVPDRLSDDPEGGGVIVSERGRFVRLSNVHCRNDADYGRVGGFVRGSMANVSLDHCSFEGDARALVLVDVSTNMLPTTSRAIVTKGLHVDGLRHLGAVDWVLEHRQPVHPGGLVGTYLRNVHVDRLRKGLLSTAAPKFATSNVAEIYDRVTMECVAGPFPMIAASTNTFGGSPGMRREFGTLRP